MDSNLILTYNEVVVKLLCGGITHSNLASVKELEPLASSQSIPHYKSSKRVLKFNDIFLFNTPLVSLTTLGNWTKPLESGQLPIVKLSYPTVKENVIITELSYSTKTVRNGIVIQGTASLSVLIWVAPPKPSFEVLPLEKPKDDELKLSARELNEYPLKLREYWKKNPDAAKKVGYKGDRSMVSITDKGVVTLDGKEIGNASTLAPNTFPHLKNVKLEINTKV